MREKITPEMLQQETDYFLAEQVLQKLYKAGFISKEEKDEIHQLNLEKFNPYLMELMV